MGYAHFVSIATTVRVIEKPKMNNNLRVDTMFADLGKQFRHEHTMIEYAVALLNIIHFSPLSLSQLYI